MEVVKDRDRNECWEDQCQVCQTGMGAVQITLSSCVTFPSTKNPANLPRSQKKVM